MRFLRPSYTGILMLSWPILRSANLSSSESRHAEAIWFPQVCGVFLLFISGTHTLMYWGLYCYPWLRDGFIVAYYLAALGCVLGGLRAKTQMQRALPMLALFGVRFLCLGTRMVLNSGSQSACIHYAAMEVSFELCLWTWSLASRSGCFN